MSRQSYKHTAPIGIGPSRETIRREERARRGIVISENRQKVFARDWRGCRCCGRGAQMRDHCHEVVSRAMLRGRPPEDIFTLPNCVRLCPQCHEKITSHEIDVVCENPDEGCNGSMQFPKHVSKWEPYANL